MKSAVTLHDIAHAAGVSVNTVSRALNDRPDISVRTRRHVLEVARRLDYRPNQLARSLRRRRTATIGVVVADLANPFFAEVVEGIERHAATRGYGIILANSEEDSSRELAAVHALVERRVDGILLAPAQHDDLSLAYLAGRGIPSCLLARYYEDRPSLAVINDDREGERLAVAHLLARGHRRILYLNGPRYNSSARLRLEGYRQAHREAGCPIDEALIVETNARLEGGLEAVTRVLRAEPGFSAIACFSDYVCFGAVRALRRARLRIPEDVAVIGYDDVDLAELVSPALSTVRIAKTRLGRTATEELIAWIESGKSPLERRLARAGGGGGRHDGKPSAGGERDRGLVILAPELIVREST